MALGGALVGALRVTLGLDTADFHKGAGKAEARATTLKSRMGGVAKGMMAFGGALAGMAVVGAVSDLVSQALDHASALGEQAQQLGVTTKTMQEYRYAASQAGIESEEMDKGLAKLTVSIGKADMGSKKMIAAFDAVGISMSDMKGKDTGQVFAMIADGMAKIEDPAVRAAIAVELFGKTGQKFDTLLAGGSKGINELTQAANELGLVLSDEQIQKADETADKMAALQQVLKMRIAGIVADNADKILAFVEALSKLSEKVGPAISNTVAAFTALDTGLKAIQSWADATDAAVVGAFQSMATGATTWFANMVTSVDQWITGKLNAAFEKVRVAVDRVKGFFHGLWDAVVGHSYIPDMVEGIRVEMDKLDAVMVNPAKVTTKETAEAFRAMKNEVGGLLDRLFPEAEAWQKYRAEIALLGKAHAAGILNAEQHAEALRRLAHEGLEEGPGLFAEEAPLLTDGLVSMEDVLDDFAKKSLPDLAATAKTSTADVITSFANMARDAVGSVRGMVGAFKSGDILGGIMGFLDLVGQVSGIVGGFKGGSTKAAAPVFNRGFRTGGSFEVPGVGNPDSQLVQFYASPGERVSIDKGVNDNGGGSNHFHLEGAVLTQDLVNQMNAIGDRAAARGASGGAAMAGPMLKRQNRQSLRGN